ncbi:hypothetical protein AbraIFM66950_011041 [Aspergillus brasiliensis]|nr:hypothetical protein AbraIFM66950_011041 [Aspergillus brasiliensis]
MAKMVSNDINHAKANRGTPCPLCDSPADHDKKSPHGTNSGLVSSQICFLEGEATIECKRRVAALTASSRAEPQMQPRMQPQAQPQAQFQMQHYDT